MKQNNYKSLIYFITATIIATIGLQLYWNVQNYNVNKQRLINEVQNSLDNGVESYFADLAKAEMVTLRDTLIDSLLQNHMTSANTYTRDSIFLRVDSDTHGMVESIRTFSHLLDSVSGHGGHNTGNRAKISMFQKSSAFDSLNQFEGLASKIIISFTTDSLDFKRLDTLLGQEFNRKNITIGYKIKHSKNDSVLGTFGAPDSKALALSTFSKSTYLPADEKLELLFTNPTLVVLKRSLTGIILSFLLSASIIACLLYLLKIINRQKQLAAIKNDLISNITHEFKTPIATVATAIEGIRNFNDANSKEKTDSYLDISSNQLQKLHLMVEKLLETATLDSDKLLLQKESTDLVQMLNRIVEKFQMLSPEKVIDFKCNVSNLKKEIDPFHFENAIANLLDNAIKYGGDQIEVNLNVLLNAVELSVTDNGGGMDKSQRDKVFDKFYRIPTGNRHDVKGFGIGLFYTKKIIEKHGGSINLSSDGEHTIFKISL
ncbi:HAMP domain-containing histidine kinase [Muriicola sp. Z0-33]|uniref:sensor histidine kinase n=1 Tax=Muriicola sp. Z0-33 TaxID=2816957 RepID=UPI0022378F82|nr:HAMP domain-containing histidine kinase [Muriicola sp. Z0-33]MCW5516111.1 HAMP domain-containing histidine kinase [Muriicola sp. Z0-33]